MIEQMSSRFAFVAVTLVLGATGLLALPESPAIPAPLANPSLIRPNAATTVTVTVLIDDPALVPNSVTLLRLGASGDQPVVVGQLHDDGKGGDAVAGDHVYTVQIALNEPTAGAVSLEVSAAFRGALKRNVSKAVTIAVSQSQ
jgi:hypothetical protein